MSVLLNTPAVNNSQCGFIFFSLRVSFWCSISSMSWTSVIVFSPVAVGASPDRFPEEGDSLGLRAPPDHPSCWGAPQPHHPAPGRLQHGRLPWRPDHPAQHQWEVSGTLTHRKNVLGIRGEVSCWVRLGSVREEYVGNHHHAFQWSILCSLTRNAFLD